MLDDHSSLFRHCGDYRAELVDGFPNEIDGKAPPGPLRGQFKLLKAFVVRTREIRTRETPPLQKQKSTSDARPKKLADMGTVKPPQFLLQNSYSRTFFKYYTLIYGA